MDLRNWVYGVWGGRDLLWRSASCHKDWVVWIREEVSHIQVFDISDFEVLLMQFFLISWCYFIGPFGYIAGIVPI